jgi:hypothetical protein
VAISAGYIVMSFLLVNKAKVNSDLEKIGKLEIMRQAVCKKITNNSQKMGEIIRIPSYVVSRVMSNCDQKGDKPQRHSRSTKISDVSSDSRHPPSPSIYDFLRTGFQS